MDNKEDIYAFLISCTIKKKQYSDFLLTNLAWTDLTFLENIILHLHMTETCSEFCFCVKVLMNQL